MNHCTVRRVKNLTVILQFSKQVGTVFSSKRKDATSIHPVKKKLCIEPSRNVSFDEETEDAFSEPPDSPFVRLVKQNYDAKDDLRGAIREFFHEEYLEHMLDSTSSSSGLDNMLEVFYLLFRHVCILSLEGGLSQDIVDTARQELDSYAFPHLSFQCECENLSSMTPKQIAKVLSFVTFYQEHWKETTFPRDRNTRMEELKSEYLRRGVHDQVRSMVENRLLLLDEDDVVENEDGTLCTRIGEDVALIVGCQISVARESLPGSMLSVVLRACNEEMQNLAGGLMFHIESNWRTMSVERLCCCINDAQILLEQFENRNESILHTDEHDDVTEILLKEFSLLSIHATRFLCERLFLDLRDDILEKIGAAEWGQGGGMIDTVVVTLKDYFEDIEEWIPADYFFPKVLKTCIDLILSNYVDAFFANTMAHGLYDRTNAVDTLQSDWAKLWEFFGTDQKEYHGRAGFYDKVSLWHRLHILEVMANILATNSQPAGLQGEILVLLKELGSESGSAAILHLFGLQQRRISASEAQEWHETIAMAQEHARMQCAVLAPVYQIPDLRNSPYIKRMRRSQRLLNDGMLDMSNTDKLVRRRVSSNLVNSSRKMFASGNLISAWKVEE